MNPVVRTSRPARTLAAVCMACLMLPCAVQSAELDQESAGPSDAGIFLSDLSGILGSNAYVAQVFTVGLEGTLHGFEVLLGREGPAQGSVQFQIRAVVAGVPDFLAAPLATTTVSFNLPTGQGYAFGDLSAFALPVSVGQRLALVGVTGTVVIPGSAPEDEYVNWRASTANPYPGGAFHAAFFNDLGNPTSQEEVDALFRTYVTVVPEPSAALLFAAGLAACGVRRHRSRPRAGLRLGRR